MKPQHYIAVLTNESLDEDSQRLWYETVKQLAPQGTVRTIEHERKQTAMIEYTINMPDDTTLQSLMVPLTRDLDGDEGEVIVTAFDMMGPKDVDWEIEASNLFDSNLDRPGFDFEFSASEEDKNEMRETVGKFVHSRWVENKITNGWRYGPMVDQKERTHPALRPWEQLPREHKRIPELSDKDILEFYKKYGYR